MSDLDTLRDDLLGAIEDAVVDSEPYSRQESAQIFLSAVFRVVERFVSSLPQDPEDSATTDSPETWQWGTRSQNGYLSTYGYEFTYEDVAGIAQRYNATVVRRRCAGPWEPMP